MWKSFCEFDNEIVVALNEVDKIPVFEATDQEAEFLQGVSFGA
jgi:hypothetical protein